MTKLIVIDPIDATHEGPSVPIFNSDDEFQLLHLRQGDDGYIELFLTTVAIKSS